MYHPFENLKNYIEDNEFRVTLFENKVHIMNYQELISIGNEKIILQAPHYQMSFFGNNLALSKLLDQEILISGRIYKVEISYAE